MRDTHRRTSGAPTHTIPMELKRMFTDDDAVSPVIGVILMVAITVILAAVIASFVLGLGSQPQTTPQTQFEFDYTDSDSDDEGLVEITHNGGESLDPAEVEVRGDAGDFSGGGSSPTDGSGEDPADVQVESGGDSLPYAWSELSSPPSQVSTGDTITVEAGSDYDFTLTYVPSEGGNTAPLADDQGPDA